jgi:hypothetical protein
MTMTLDVNSEMFKLEADQRFKCVLTTTINLDGTPSDSEFDPSLLDGACVNATAGVDARLLMQVDRGLCTTFSVECAFSFVCWLDGRCIWVELKHGAQAHGEPCWTIMNTSCTDGCSRRK